MFFKKNNSFSVAPHVHIPFDLFDKYLAFIKKEKLNLEIYFGSVNFDSLTKKGISELKGKLDYNPRLSIHAPFMDLSPGAVDPKVRELTTSRFSKVLAFAEILKPEVIVFHSGYDKWKYDNRVDIWLEGSLKTWEQINSMASDMGIRIAIENIFEDEPENLRMLAEEINSENFGLCFDTGHFNLFSKLSLSEWLKITKPYIKAFHLHDNTRQSDDHMAIGDGSFNFRLLFKELDVNDYVCTIEAHTIKDVKKSMKRFREYLK